ncbi:hypothetical protein PPERSA_03215 [Pseudocohnilembus persalinus]|uniref:PIPK domain-containing protein n=1 Tax=Pseudocohnilembus persalinus TaxID=266149 RepID=A0A0V0QE58_PSEPJ|nr:hypothetical protein PPERSA_03215 [Pseudocohnilembus persalinus]|eukprot:KRX00482.1 hypothetical protein PPERSA_03215 [Pseudocohnilembus persalinus]
MYQKQHLLDCNLLENSEIYTPEKISEILTIYPIDTVIILTIGLFSVISSCFIIYTFKKYPKCREQPGDIILAISISEFILNFHWITMTINDLIYGQGPISTSTFCQVESFFSISAGVSEFVYNCLFCLFIVTKIRNSLYGKSFPQLYSHIFAAVCMVGCYLFCYLTNSTGLSLFGMCSFKQGNNFGVFGIIIVIVFLIISIFTIVYFKRNIPKNQDFLIYRKTVLSYYNRYLVAQIIIWSILAISNFIVGFNCTSWQIPILNIFVTIGNTAKLCTSIVLSIMRYKDPIIMKQIRPKLVKFFPCLFKPQQDNDYNLLEDNQNIYDILSEKLRISQVYSMICGVIQGQILSPQQPAINIAQLNESEYKERYKFQLNESSIKKIDCLVKEGDTEKLQLQKYKVYMYAPRIFKTFISQDSKLINLEQSFNMEDNFYYIQEKFSSDGGRSGSFFYATKDNKLLIKTMLKSEKDIILKKLRDYAQHFQENPNSFISKIYGIFTFKVSGIFGLLGGYEEHILIMRNILNCPNEYKLRSYDLKGSTEERQVIKLNISSELKKQLLKEKTLKDLDFEQNEVDGKIHVDANLQYQISNILTEDVHFFMKKMKVMDYSLLVLKVNWRKYAEDFEVNERNEIAKRFQNIFQCFPSKLEPGVYYQISIIDYLQVWNQKKKAEKNIKGIKKLNLNSDVSAQNPSFYGDRFIKKIAKKLFIQ